MKKIMNLLWILMCVLVVSCSDVTNVSSSNGNETNPNENEENGNDEKNTIEINAGIYFPENNLFKEYSENINLNTEKTITSYYNFIYDEYDSQFNINTKTIKCNDNAIFYICFNKITDFYIKDYFNEKNITLNKAAKESNIYSYLLNKYKNSNNDKKDASELPYDIWITDLNFNTPFGENSIITNYKYLFTFKNPSDSKRIENNYIFKINCKKCNYENIPSDNFKYKSIYPADKLNVKLDFNETSDFNSFEYAINEVNKNYNGKLKFVNYNDIEIPGNYNYKTGLSAEGYYNVKIKFPYNNDNLKIYFKNTNGDFELLNKDSSGYYFNLALNKIYIQEIYDELSLNKDNEIYNQYKDNMYIYFNKWSYDENNYLKTTHILNINNYKQKAIFNYPEYYFNEKGYLLYKNNVNGYEDKDDINYAVYDNKIEFFIETSDPEVLCSKWIYKLNVSSSIFFDENIYNNDSLYNSLYK